MNNNCLTCKDTIIVKSKDGTMKMLVCNNVKAKEYKNQVGKNMGNNCVAKKI